MTAHSNTGASSMERWSACPGSVRQCEGLPNTSSSYAQEGTDAHALAALCLSMTDKALQDPVNWITLHVTPTDLAGYSDFVVTREMAEAVQVYADHLNNTFERGDVDQVEVRFDLSSVHPGCFGTADHVRWREKERLLIVTDYKHGAGVPVSPKNNPQLMYYGLGALLAAGYPASRVRLVIVQPRCAIGGETIRSWEIDALDLVDFKADLKQYAVATEAPDAPLVPGDHCRFCPAAAVCPALLERAQLAAKSEFAPVVGSTEVLGGIPSQWHHVSGVYLHYDPAKLKAALDLRETLRGWLSALDEFAYAEAVAGRCPPGYKLVDKRAIRRWTDDSAVAAHLVMEYGASKDDIYEPPTLKSPAKLEAAKIIKKGELDKDFVTKESSGFALVPEGDKRPAVKILTAAQEFTAVEAPEMCWHTEGLPAAAVPPVTDEIPDFLKRKKG